MKLPAYPKYKPSGVEWLGDVPEKWEVKAIKWESPVSRGASPRPIDDERYFDEDGHYAWVRISDVTAAGMYLEKTEQQLSALGSSLSVKLHPGSLFLSIAGSVGKPCITRIEACIHDGFVYFPRWKKDAKFLYYIFASEAPYRGLGKMGTQLNLNTDTVGSIRIGLPTISEQRAVSDFLDARTAKIDALLTKRRALIEKLKEKRTALISRAVTRGLNPNAKLKPSGIEWLGDIPKHWDLKRFGYISTVVRGASPRPAGDSRYFDGDFMPWITVAEVTKDNGMFLTATDTMLTEEGVECSRVIPTGTLVLSNSGRRLACQRFFQSRAVRTMEC